MSNAVFTCQQNGKDNNSLITFQTKHKVEQRQRHEQRKQGCKATATGTQQTSWQGEINSINWANQSRSAVESQRREAPGDSSGWNQGSCLAELEIVRKTGSAGAEKNTQDTARQHRKPLVCCDSYQAPGLSMWYSDTVFLCSKFTEQVQSNCKQTCGSHQSCEPFFISLRILEWRQ